MFIASINIDATRNTIMQEDMCKAENEPEKVQTLFMTMVHWNILMNLIRKEKAFMTWACPRYHFQY